MSSFQGRDAETFPMETRTLLTKAPTEMEPLNQRIPWGIGTLGTYRPGYKLTLVNLLPLRYGTLLNAPRPSVPASQCHLVKPLLWLLFACWLGFQGLFCENTRAVSLPPRACPDELESLTALLIRDVPNYANRVIQRSRRLSRRDTSRFYVILAGRPEFTPLPLNSGVTSITSTDASSPQQVFFTTLERQYIGGKAVESQIYHWIFLSKTSGGWRLALMFSQFGSSRKEQPPTPPQESSNGIVGQAVTNWLRDCRAGVIKTPMR